MALIGSVGGISPSLYGKLPETIRPEGLNTSGMGALGKTSELGVTAGTQETGATNLFENLIQAVDAKQSEANNVSRQVLLGQNDQLHQSVIAMQEASVAFSLMVEVRNKLVDSYQELMRLPA